MSKSTIISCCLNAQKFQWSDSVTINPGVMSISTFSVPYSSILARLTAGLDVDVYFSAPEQGTILVHRNIYSEKFKVNQWIKDISYASFHEGDKYITYINKNVERLRDVVYNNQVIGFAALNTLYQYHPTFLGVLTIGGLDADSPNHGNKDFMGYISTSAITAKRDSDHLNLTEVMKEWANEQYKILIKQGLTEKDKFNLPYIVCKYGIDMTDELKIHIYDNNRMLRQDNLKTLLKHLKIKKYKLVLPLSDYDENRISAYVDYERTFKLIHDNEYLFKHEINNEFLNIAESNYNCNILKCIKQKAKSLDYTLKIKIEENKVNLSISGNSKGLIIEIE